MCDSVYKSNTHLTEVRGVGDDQRFCHFQGRVLLDCITGHQHWGVRGELSLIRMRGNYGNQAYTLDECSKVSRRLRLS